MRTLHTIITFTCILSGLTVSAQKIVDKKTAQEVSKLQDKGTELKEGWAKGAAFNASFNQASLTNWFSGGDRKSLGLNLGFKATANLKKGNWFYKNNLDAAYGLLSTSSTNGIRKTDDRWVYTTSLNRKAAKNWYYTLAGQIKSQFADGYAYTSDGSKTLGSALFSPGDVKLGLGFTYQPNAEFSAYISPATAKMMLRLDRRFIHTTLFGVDSNKTTAFDMGAFARLDYKKEIKKDLMYTASLDVFYGYVLKNYNFYLGNLINWKLNKYFGATFGLDIAYDNTQPTPNFGKDPVTGKEIITGTSVKMQLKEIFGLGFNYTF